MLKYRKVRKIDVSKILDPIINGAFPDLLIKSNDKIKSDIYELIYFRIIAGGLASRNLTAIYASLINHKMQEYEFKITIYVGALMIVVDDIFDHCSTQEISKFTEFTSNILKSTIEGSFDIDYYNNYFEKKYHISLYKNNSNTSNYYSLAKLAFQLYCKTIFLMNEAEEQKKNYALCLQNI
jgi:hypothetical protein